MKQFLTALVIVIILVGGYFLWQSSASAPSESDTGTPVSNLMPVPGSDTPEMVVGGGDDASEEPVVVSNTDAGFSPSSVTIKKGQAVRFVNNSSKEDVWPASAVHPTHSVYPEKSDADCLGSSFDACKGLKPGESWEFTFNSMGEWKFHDHLHPSKFGSVTVTE